MTPRQRGVEDCDGGQPRRVLFEAYRDLVEQFCNRFSVQAAIIALIDPERDRQADDYYKDTAH